MPQKYKVAMVSLGCPKNQVDAEIMLSVLKSNRFLLTDNLKEADAAIVNTCGFIEDAKRESIESILETAQLKQTGRLKTLIVTGCLAQRYKDEITKEMPEVDVVVGIGSNSKIAEIVLNSLTLHQENIFSDNCNLPLDGERILSTPSYYAYLKIADGCDNRCAYCAIPQIRGRYRSRRMEEILSEARALSEKGVKELILIAQDTTRYGFDLYGELSLSKLLVELEKVDGIQWIRLLYCYPDYITDELIGTLAAAKKVLPYIDLPLQHCDEKVLKRMNRRGNAESLILLVQKLRNRVKDIVIRTTFITGFPGEGEREFENLVRFIDECKFERLGCFTYSPEEGTAAASYRNQVAEELKQKRREIIMTKQYELMAQNNKGKIGRQEDVLVEGYDKSVNQYFGRTKADAPDIDGRIFFDSDKQLRAGDFVKVKVIDILEYDLLGNMVSYSA